MNKIEELRLVKGKVECREGDSPVMEGYSAVFNSWTDICGMWDEQIAPGAFNRVLNEKQDTRGVANHNADLLLGRVGNGTVVLRADATGLFASITPNMNTSVGKDWVEYVRRGDVYGQSFKYFVGEDKWRFQAGKKDQRTIVELSDLLDVGPVTSPAYEATSITIRKQLEKQGTEVRSLYQEMVDAFSVEADELSIQNKLRDDQKPVAGERGRYLIDGGTESRSLVISLAEYDSKPLLRTKKSTPISILRARLDLREREV